MFISLKPEILKAKFQSIKKYKIFFNHKINFKNHINYIKFKNKESKNMLRIEKLFLDTFTFIKSLFYDTFKSGHIIL